MKPWYKKKKVWASILGALAVVLTVFLAPEGVDQVKVIAAAILEAALAIGFVQAEASIDKADRNGQGREEAFKQGLCAGKKLKE